MAQQRLFTLAEHLRRRFSFRVRKIPLDAGFFCPNRDGTLSTEGCCFCNPRGSGSGLDKQGLRLPQQWEYWKQRLSRKRRAGAFLAYLQSFSNTYGPLEKLRFVLSEIAQLPDCIGLCLGTRPDCLDAEKLDLIASQPFSETWLDLGLQSSNDETLARINRGHTAACFAAAVHEAAARNLSVCAHVIAGLPGETPEDFLATIRFLNELPIRGVKFHNLYVCRGSTLARDWRNGGYTPLTLACYADQITQAVAMLRPDIVVHRLNGDPAPDELLAPDWAGRKTDVLHAIHGTLQTRNILQGQLYSPKEPLCA
jgi:hypothetical protein